MTSAELVRIKFGMKLRFCIYLVARVVRILKLPLLSLSSRLGSSFSCCAPAATNPEFYAEHYAGREAARRHRHLSHRQSSRTTAHYVTL
jgi:hypothetical protein